MRVVAFELGGDRGRDDERTSQQQNAADGQFVGFRAECRDCRGFPLVERSLLFLDSFQCGPCRRLSVLNLLGEAPSRRRELRRLEVEPAC